MKIGERVFHPKYGWGTIRLLLTKMNELWARVDFGYATCTILVSELLDSPQGSPPTTPPVPEPSPSEAIPEVKKPGLFKLNLTQVSARKGIQALKLGQVLESHIFDLSVGTQEIETTFQSKVNQAKNYQVSPLLIEGAWGTGKTHVLTLLQAISKKSSMATAYVILDGHSASLGKPMELMGEISESLRFPFGAVLDSLSEILRRAVFEQKIPQLKREGAHIIAGALNALHSRTLDHPDACHLVEDYFCLAISASQARYQLARMGLHAPYLPTIKRSRVAERAVAFRNLLANWAYFAKVMGANGLVIILDELDVEYVNTAWRTQYAATLRERRTAVLKELANLTNAKVPLVLAFASAPAENDSDPENNAVANLIEIFKKQITHIKVPYPTKDQLRYLFDRLFSFYNTAYQGSLDNLTQDKKNLIWSRLVRCYESDPNPIPRRFVRLTLEAFDLISLTKNPDIQSTLEILG